MNASRSTSISGTGATTTGMPSSVRRRPASVSSATRSRPGRRGRPTSGLAIASSSASTSACRSVPGRTTEPLRTTAAGSSYQTTIEGRYTSSPSDTVADMAK